MYYRIWSDSFYWSVHFHPMLVCVQSSAQIFATLASQMDPKIVQTQPMYFGIVKHGHNLDSYLIMLQDTLSILNDLIVFIGHFVGISV